MADIPATPSDPPRWSEEVRIAARLGRARWRSQAQYRSSLLMQVVGNFSITGVELLAIWIMFQRFDNLGGWTGLEVAFLFGLSGIGFGVAQILSAGFSTFSTTIRLGDFDRVLTRPISPILQVATNDVSMHHVGRSIQGIATLLVALTLMDVAWGVREWLYLLLIVLSAIALYFALFVGEAVLCFWTVDSTEAVNAVTYGGRTFAEYPLNIFDRWLRNFFLWVVPISFVSYLPSVLLLDKPDPLGLPAWLGLLAPVAALAFCLLIGALWNVGVRHYHSTGS